MEKKLSGSDMGYRAHTSEKKIHPYSSQQLLRQHISSTALIHGYCSCAYYMKVLLYLTDEPLVPAAQASSSDAKRS